MVAAFFLRGAFTIVEPLLQEPEAPYNKTTSRGIETTHYYLLRKVYDH
jgi:hypothetical protein